MLKVLHITKTFFPDTYGGSEEVVRQICLASSVHGIQSDVLTLTDKHIGKSSYDGIHITAFKKNFTVLSTPFSWQLLFKIKKIAAEYDIIHCHFPWPYYDLLCLLHLLPKRIVVTYHCDAIAPRLKWIGYLYKPVQDYFLRKATKIIATSENMRNSSSVLQQFKEKTIVIPLGLDPDSYPNPSEQLLQRWSEKFSRPFILFIGMLRHYKGLPYLLQAAQGFEGDIVIAGEGHEQAHLATIVRNEKLKNVYLLSRVSPDDKVALLKLCTGVVLPSTLRSEAFGVVLLEGAMFKKPLISTELGTGTSYVNQNEVTGFVIPPKNADILREKMNLLLSNSELTHRMGEAAYQRFNRLFLMKYIVQQYIELYQNLTVE